MIFSLGTKNQDGYPDIHNICKCGVVRVQCARRSLRAQPWHVHPTGSDPLPRRASALLAPDDLGLGAVAVADLDVLGGDPHVGLPRPAQHGHREVGTVGALGEDAIGVVVHAERDPVLARLDHLVDLLLEVAGEELEGTSLGRVLGGEHVSHHAGQLVATVVVLGVPKDRRDSNFHNRLEIDRRNIC
jgi:hypothetical protein